MNGTGASVLIKFTGDTKDVTGKMNGLNRTLGSVTKGFVAGSLITKGLSAAFNMVSNSVGDAVQRFDTMKNFPKVMSNLGISAKDSQKQINILSKKLTGLPTSLDTAAMSVQRLTSKNGDIKKSTNLFLAMNNAILAGGAPAHLQSAAIEQLSQAYAKGKPDMVEWRSMMSAMPAQLKQVATAMGYVDADALGSALRKGDVSMDSFMNTMVQLNEKGIKGFKSFEEQARNATGGIQTSIANMKTAITRGLTNAFNVLDKTLQNAGLGGIAGVINSIGKAFENAIIAITPFIPAMVKIVQIAIKLAPIWAPIIAGLIAYQKAMSLVNKVNELTSKMANLPGIFGKIGTSAQNSSKGVVKFLGAHKGLAAGLGIAGLAVGGMIALYKKSGGDANKMADMVTKTVDKVVNTVTQIAQKLPQIVNKVLPKMLNAITTALPKIINAISQALPKIITAITSAIPKIIPPLVNGLVTIITTLANALPTLVPILINGAITLILALVNALPQIIIALVNALPKVITAIVTGLIKCIPQLIQGAIQLVIGLVKALPKIIMSLIKAIPTIIKEIVRALIQNAPQLISTGIQLIQALWQGFKSWIGQMFTNVKNFAKSLPTRIKNGIGNLISIGRSFIQSLWTGAKMKAGEIYNNAKNFAKKIPSKIKQGLGSLGSVGRNFIQGLWGGIRAKFDSVVNGVKNLASKLPKAVRKVLGIASPSKVMFKIGGFTTEGFIEGIGSMQKQLDRMISSTFNLSPNVTGTASTHFSPNVNVNVVNNMKTDPLGQMVNNIKTFSGGAKNDYNYGMGA